MPENLEGNRFLGRDGENCLSEAWNLDGIYKQFPCSEFTIYVAELSASYDFDIETTYLILNIDGKSQISLDDPIRAVSFINYVLTNDQSQSTLDVLKNTYKNSDMTTFLAVMRKMVQNFLLDGPCQKIKMSDMLNGYKNEKASILYDQKDGGLQYQQGQEVIMNDQVTPIWDRSEKSTSQVIGLFTGALKVDQVSKVRFNNDKNYVNKLLPVRDGFNYSNVAVSPTPSTENLINFGNTTNGMQF